MSFPSFTHLLSCVVNSAQIGSSDDDTIFSVTIFSHFPFDTIPLHSVVNLTKDLLYSKLLSTLEPCFLQNSSHFLALRYYGDHSFCNFKTVLFPFANCIDMLFRTLVSRMDCVWHGTLSVCYFNKVPNFKWNKTYLEFWLFYFSYFR